MTIDERWRELSGRPSGFDYLRVSLAAAVVLWHSYQVAYGTPAAAAFWHASPAGYAMRLIVPMFFALSGFLVAGSMYRSSNLRVFLTLRAIRIGPALFVEVVLAALVLGPLFTVYPLADYVADHKLHAYFFNIVGFIHYYLPGVFLLNPEAEVVNSQLWTVPYELECYLLISLLAVAGYFRHRARTVPFFIAATLAVAAWNMMAGIPASPDGHLDGRVMVLCFCAGLLLYTYRDRVPLRADLALGSLVLAGVLCVLPEPAPYLMPVFAAYATVYLGLCNPPRTWIVTSGDYSYGVYLYSCPIQQAVQELGGLHLSWWQNFALSLPVVVCFALFSWWCVEKPFLKVRRYLLLPPKPNVPAIA